MSHVVVVGGGFGGVRAVERLTRSGVGADVQVTLVDRTNHHTFAPLLYQVATAGLSPQDVAHSLRAMNAGRENVQVRQGVVTDIDLDGHEVVLGDGSVLAYDHLILAPGAVTADFGVPGVAEHALPLKSVHDALAIRNHVLERLEAATRPAGAAGDLTIAVVGGGATGVELAGAMAELCDVLLRRDFVELADRQVRVVLVERLGTVLAGFSASSRSYTERVLERAGVELMLGVGIAQVEADHLVLDDGAVLPTRTVVWAAGVRANPLLESLGIELDRSGRVTVESDLSLAGHPEVSVVGDAAIIRDAGMVIPQVAPAAMQQGRHAAEQVLRRIAGRPTTPFHYRDKGSMATIGRNAAVNEYPFGLELRGRVAWVAWLFLHLLYLAGFRNRLSALLTWGWSYLTFDRSLRVVVDPSPFVNRSPLAPAPSATAASPSDTAVLEDV